ANALEPVKVYDYVVLDNTTWWEDSNELEFVIKLPADKSPTSFSYLQLESGYLLPLSWTYNDGKEQWATLPVLPNVTQDPMLVVDTGGELSAWKVRGYVQRSGKVTLEPGIKATGLSHFDLVGSAT